MKSTLLQILILILSTQAIASESLEHYFSYMGFKLEETEFSKIKNILGDAKTHQEGDAADFYSAICYRLPSKKITVYFESGEMGGGTTLLGYRVEKEEKTDFLCASSENKLIENYNIGSLLIGENFNKTITAIPNGYEPNENGVFFYSSKIPFTKDEIIKNKVKDEDLKYAYWGQNVTIELTSKNNTVTGFKVFKVTSW